MKKLYTYIIILPLLVVSTAAAAQEVPSQIDSISLGNLFQLMAGSSQTAGQELFEKRLNQK